MLSNLEALFIERENKRKHEWCLDSGATSHLCNDARNFRNLTNCKRESLNLANNTSTEILARGTIPLVGNVFGKNKHFDLNNALHVPDLRTNVMSVGKITDKGHEVLFKRNVYKKYCWKDYNDGKKSW